MAARMSARVARARRRNKRAFDVYLTYLAGLVFLAIWLAAHGLFVGTAFCALVAVLAIAALVSIGNTGKATVGEILRVLRVISQPYDARRRDDPPD